MHFAVILNMFYSDDSYNSPRNMELTGDLPIPNSPAIRSPPSAVSTRVRRNLLREFNRASAPEVCDSPGSDHVSQAFDMTVQTEPSELKESGWNVFIKFWCFIIISSVLLIVYIYRSIPGYIFAGFPKELLAISALIICVIIVVCRLCGDNQTKRRGSVSSKAVQDHGISTDDIARRRNMNVQVKRIFKGDGSDVWSEFIRYFENIATLNGWTIEMKRRVLLTTFRGQAETFVYGLPDYVLSDYNQLVHQIDNRFGHKAMKESYVAEAKMRKKLKNESFRDFGQAIADLYRRAHPGNRDYVEEASLKTFLDNCSYEDDFRLAVKRTRPKTLQDAVTSAMQEECIRMTENMKVREKKIERPVYGINNSGSNQKSQMKTTRRNDRECFLCNSKEHLFKNCPNRKRGSNREEQRLNEPRPRQ